MALMSEERPVYHPLSASTSQVDSVLSSPSSSAWLTDSLRSALLRDPVDAARDAELLAQVLGARADALLSVSMESKGQG